MSDDLAQRLPDFFKSVQRTAKIMRSAHDQGGDRLMSIWLEDVQGVEEAVEFLESQAKATKGNAGMAGGMPTVRRSTAGTGLQVGEPTRIGKLSMPALGHASNVSEIGVTAGETAPLSSSADETGNVAHAFRNADAKDWEHLDLLLGHSGHGKFWRAVFEEVRTAISPSPAEARKEDWREDPTNDERWNAGVDFCMVQLCSGLGVDPHTVTWDAATETVEGDMQSVQWNIIRAAFGDDFDPDELKQLRSQVAGLTNAFRNHRCVG